MKSSEQAMIAARIIAARPNAPIEEIAGIIESAFFVTEKDAARYRFLEGRGNWKVVFSRLMGQKVYPSFTAAVDEAMAEPR